MQDSDNPFASPQASGPQGVSAAPLGAVTPAMLESAKKARTWAAVVGWTALAVMVVAFVRQMVQMGRQAPFGPAGGMLVGIGVCAFVIMIIVYGVPAVLSLMFGGKLAHFVALGDPHWLAAALRTHRVLWIYVGVLMIVFLALIVFGLLMIVLAAVAG